MLRLFNSSPQAFSLIISVLSASNSVNDILDLTDCNGSLDSAGLIDSVLMSDASGSNIKCSLVSADTSGVGISDTTDDVGESVWLEFSKIDKSNESSSSASLNVSSKNEVFNL